MNLSLPIELITDAMEDFAMGTIIGEKRMWKELTYFQAEILLENILGRKEDNSGWNLIGDGLWKYIVHAR